MRLPARPTPIASKQSRCIIRRQYRHMRRNGVPRLGAKNVISNLELAFCCDEVYASVEAKAVAS